MIKKKYQLAKWSVVCRPKDQGGLGIYDLEVKSRALLGKWLFKLLLEEGIWQTIRNFLRESMLARSRCLRLYGNLELTLLG
jgi:hypothetical protein